MRSPNFVLELRPYDEDHSIRSTVFAVFMLGAENSESSDVMFFLAPTALGTQSITGFGTFITNIDAMSHLPLVSKAFSAGLAPK